MRQAKTDPSKFIPKRITKRKYFGADAKRIERKAQETFSKSAYLSYMTCLVPKRVERVAIQKKKHIRNCRAVNRTSERQGISDWGLSGPY